MRGKRFIVGATCVLMLAVGASVPSAGLATGGRTNGMRASVLSRTSGGATAIVGGLHRDPYACFALLDGTPTFCSGAAAVDINIDAHGSGSGPAVGEFMSGENGGANFTRVRLTCMTVAGNRGVVGGYITASSNTPVVGDALLFYVVDNGGPGNAAPLDEMSGLEIYVPDEGGLPAGFPKNCGVPVSTFTGYTDVNAGDVSIHAGL